MRLAIPDPVSFRPDHPVNRRNRCTKALIGTPDGPAPIQQRAVTKPGNVSMYDHLQAMKYVAEQELEVDLQWQ